VNRIIARICARHCTRRPFRMVVIITGLAAAVTLGAFLPIESRGQGTRTKDGYDVISVRPSRPNTDGVSVGGSLNSFVARNATLADLIRTAYDLPCNCDSAKLPKWAREGRFDIQAKIEDLSMKELNALSEERRRKMLQSLLEDRFHLKVHSESKMYPAYELTVAKGGSKLKPVKSHNNTVVSSEGQQTPSSGASFSTGENGLFELKVTEQPVDSIIGSLSRELQRRVIDKTGLDGIYSFSLKWYPDLDKAGTTGNNNSGPSLFEALQDQLGLKLRSVSAPIEFLEIDHVEKPSDN
jgi:uncharacterized protein (TIGR03435 family)